MPAVRDKRVEIISLSEVDEKLFPVLLGFIVAILYSNLNEQ